LSELRGVLAGMIFGGLIVFGRSKPPSKAPIGGFEVEWSETGFDILIIFLQ